MKAASQCGDFAYLAAISLLISASIARLLNRQLISAAEEAVFAGEMFHCPDLYAHISPTIAMSISSSSYHISTPQLFLERLFVRSVQLSYPCLHDESYAYLDIFRQIMPQPRAMVLHVETERNLVERLYGSSSSQIRRVIGEGVDTDFVADATRFRRKYELIGSLCTGCRAARSREEYAIAAWLIGGGMLLKAGPMPSWYSLARVK